MSTTFEDHTKISAVPHPYPGLRPFRHNESEIFFGREEQIDTLLSRLEDHRFLAVIGPSGCGKSSLILAGMIPALEAGYMASAGFRWHVATMQPGAAPLHALAEALLKSSAIQVAADHVEEESAFLQATLRRGPLGLVEALRKSPIADGQNLLLLVDQFEELFTFGKDGDSCEAREFVALLLATASCPDVPVYVVITMRSDFLGHCTIFSGLPEAMTDSQFLTPRLTRDQQLQAIECPLALFDAQIDPVVTRRILNDMGTDPDQLPLMQHLLMRMWRMARKRAGTASGITLTSDEYAGAHGLKEALSDHAEWTYSQLGTDRARFIAEVLFRHLTDVAADGQVVRRPASLARICAIVRTTDDPKATEDEVLRVVDAFREEGRSFLMPPIQVASRPALLQISHESLIRQWERLKQWTVDEARARRVARMVATDAKVWKERLDRGEDDRKFVLTGIRLEEALAWSDARRAPADSDEFRLEREFLDRCRYFRDEAVRQEESAKYAQELERKNQELLEAGRKLGESNRNLTEASRNLEMTNTKVRRTNSWLKGLLGLVAAGSIALLAMIFVARNQYNKAAAALVNEGQARVEEGKLRRDKEVALEQKSAAREVLRITRLGNAEIDGSTRLLLAAEAMRVSTRHGEPPVPEAEELFRDALRPFENAGIARKVIGRHDSPVSALVFVDNRWLVSGGEDGVTTVLDLQQNGSVRQPTVQLDHESAVTAVAIDRIDKRDEARREHRWIATGTKDGILRLWPFADVTGDNPFTVEPSFILFGHGTGVTDMEFSRDGKWLVTSDQEGVALRWDLDLQASPQPKSERLQGHGGAIRDIAIDPTSRILITGSLDKTVRRWDLTLPLGSPDQKPVLLQEHRSSVNDVALCVEKQVNKPNEKAVDTPPCGSPDDATVPAADDAVIDAADQATWLASASEDNIVYLWDLRNRDLASLGTSVAPFQLEHNPSKFVRCVSFGGEGQWIVTGTDEGIVRLWMLNRDWTKEGSAKKPIPCSWEGRITSGSIEQVSISGDGQWLTVSSGNLAYLWRLSQKGPFASFTRLAGHEAELSYVGPGLSSVTDAPRVLRFAFMNEEQEIKGGTAGPSAQQSAAKAKVVSLLTAASDGALLEWDVRGENSVIDNFDCETFDAAIFSPDANQLLTVGSTKDKGQAALWAKSGTRWVQRSMIDYNGGPERHHAQFSVDGKLLVLPTGQTLNVYNMNSDDPLQQSQSSLNVQSDVDGVVVSPDGQWLVAKTTDQNAKLKMWKLTGKAEPEPVDLGDHARESRGAEFSADSSLLAICTSLGTVRLWGLSEGNSRTTLGQPQLELAGPRFTGVLTLSADNRWLATAHEDNVVRIWDLLYKSQTNPSFVLRGHQQLISRMQMIGERLLTEDFASCRLWDASSWAKAGPSRREKDGEKVIHETYDALYVFNKENSQRSVVRFSRDLNSLAEGQADGSVRVWQVNDGKSKVPIAEWFGGQNTEILAVRFSEDGQHVLSASGDGTLRQWPLEANPRFDAPFNEELVMSRLEALVGRNFMKSEWQTYFENEDYRKTLDTLPVHFTTLDLSIVQLRNDQFDTDTLAQLTKIFQADQIVGRGFEVNQAEAQASEEQAIADAGYHLHFQRATERARSEGKYDVATAEFKVAIGFPAGNLRRQFDPERYARQLAFWWYLEDGRRLALDDRLNDAKATMNEAAQLASIVGDSAPSFEFDPVAELDRIPASVLAKARIENFQTQVSQVRELIPGGDVGNFREEYRDLQIRFPDYFVAEEEARWVASYAKSSVQYGELMPAQLDRAAQLLELAGQLHDSQKVPDARKLINRLRAQTLLQQVTYLAQEIDGFETARQKLKEVAQLDPGLGVVPDVWAGRIAAPALAFRARAAAAEGKLTETIEVLQQVKGYDQELSFDPATIAAQYVPKKEESVSVEKLINQGRISDAVDAVNKALASDPTLVPSAETLNELCWFGCLLGKAAEVRFAGERAVSLEPSNADYWDTRGFARALTGAPVEDVISDFEIFLAWSDRDEEINDMRREWITALRSEQKPEQVFTAELLEKIKQQTPDGPWESRVEPAGR